MATSMQSKVYGPPKIPKTPSRAINNMLDSRFSKPSENFAKHIIATVICSVFTVISRLYNLIHKNTTPSHRMWMISCGTVSVVCIFAAYLVYSIIIGSSFLLHAILYYGCIMASLVAVGLCVSGMVFFDKEGLAEGFEKKN